MKLNDMSSYVVQSLVLFSFHIILNCEGNFYHSNINCRQVGKQMSVKNCLCQGS